MEGERYINGGQRRDTFAARQLAKGLTLVPYWGRSADGHRIPCCAWVRLRPGEGIADAARRLQKN